MTEQSEVPAQAPENQHDAEQNEELTASELRGYIRKAPLTRQTVGFYTIFSEVYVTVFGIAVLLAISFSLVSKIRDTYLEDSAKSGPNLLIQPLTPIVSVNIAWALLALVTLSAAVLLIGRLGPAHLDPPRTQWLLPLPVSRSSLLRPMVLRWAYLSAALGAVIGMFLAIVEPSELTASKITFTVLSCIGLFLCGFAVAQAAQNLAGSRLLNRILTGLLVLLVLLGLITALGLPITGSWLLWLPTSWPIVAATGQVWPVALLPVGIVACVAVLPGLGRITSTSLREHSARSSLIQSSIQSMDASAFSSSFLGQSTGSRRNLAKNLLASSPSAVLIKADALRYLRHPGRLLGLAVLAVIPAILHSFTGGQDAGVTLVSLLVCALMASGSMASPLKLNAGNPILDRLLPIPSGSARRLHSAVPAILLFAWAVVAFGLLWLTGVGSPIFFIAGIIAGPALAGAAIRGAYKKPVDWSRPAIATPFGALPPGVAAQFFAGPDVAAISMAPVLISLIAGAAPTILIPVQLGLSLLMFLILTRKRDEKPEQ
ncbi:membrane protein, putative [Renibacterium salmoninarum ATCC 33209]|uniref:Membrane protein, putative n=1 Tax=Renibacterium salmoninarum (strain ATCC 33209 / DSM 20767 / JCM 11484 / NBRC 15589 / NCIMB 2235) TaxID=288705 RepID=A9WUC3_RENSM|nr:DUF6297 family protein [Renibacterium salmoninarum]ABY24794.1 membrane protein, putative [Renibacterium salmoninarum ATCC 33209]